MDFSPIGDPLFYFVAVPAVILTGISKAGFGGAVGSLSVPLMSLVIAPPQAVALMLPILLAMDAMGLVAFRGRVDWRILKLALPAGLAGILAGWLLFGQIDDRWLRGLIGAEALLFGLHKLREGSAAWSGPAQSLRRGPAFFWSTVSGFTSFISHAGGPPIMQFLMPLKLQREIFVGTLAWFFAVINFAKIGPYAQLGLLDWTNLGTALALAPAVPVGYLIGLKILARIPTWLFVRIATIGLLLTGVKLLADAVLAPA